MCFPDVYVWHVLPRCIIFIVRFHHWITNGVFKYNLSTYNSVKSQTLGGEAPRPRTLTVTYMYLSSPLMCWTTPFLKKTLHIHVYNKYSRCTQSLNNLQKLDEISLVVAGRLSQFLVIRFKLLKELRNKREQERSCRKQEIELVRWNGKQIEVYLVFLSLVSNRDHHTGSTVESVVCDCLLIVTVCSYLFVMLIVWVYFLGFIHGQFLEE